MRYSNITPAEFICRPNRFAANVLVSGKRETVHVKNTGRCRELLIPGKRVYLAKAEPGTERKTAYDLISVEKGNRTVNIDSQAPNILVKEWLEKNFRGSFRPEHTYGKSRIDFLLEPGVPGSPEKILMEVKGCTLEADGKGYFPDAPTERGEKHIRELISARREGIGAVLAFVIQLEGVREVLPNRETDPAFSEAFDDAVREGVTVVYFTCSVIPGEIMITGAETREKTDISDLFQADSRRKNTK